jgi:hypothetical protein
MRLALSLRRTLGEMAEMPGYEFALWQQFMATEPIGHQREDINFAMLKMQIAGLAGAKNTTLNDYLIQWGEPVGDDVIEAPINDPDFYRAAFKEMTGQK